MGRQKQLVFGSDLDTKETLKQKSMKFKGSTESKSSFIKAHYRYRNLELAELLERSKYCDQDDINRVVRNLRFCSSTCIIERKKCGETFIINSSKTCKNAHCALCARAKSNKLAIRAVNAINYYENDTVFNGKYFYFLTLTVKHDADTRNYIYLNDFNGYCKQLFRSKVWKRLFPYSKQQPTSGWLHSKECTFTKNGYHIHAHIIICTTPLKAKVLKVEQELRDKWLKITKDSTGVQLDLIKDMGITEQDKYDDKKSTQAKNVIKELFKYGTKTGKFEEWDEEKTDMYAQWIINTKGKNFVNASGFFRGMGITGSKSKYDTKYEPKLLNDESDYYIGSTAKIRFNYNHKKCYSSQFRREISKKVYIESLNENFVNISDIKEMMQSYLTCDIKESEIVNLINGWTEKERKEMEFNKEMTIEINQDKQRHRIKEKWEKTIIPIFPMSTEQQRESSFVENM